MKPGYTVRDLFSYGGFIAGAAVFMLVSRQLWEMHHLVRLICAVVAGFICGGIGDRIYAFVTAESSKHHHDDWSRGEKSRDDDDRDERFSP